MKIEMNSPQVQSINAQAASPTKTGANNDFLNLLMGIFTDNLSDTEAMLPITLEDTGQSEDELQIDKLQIKEDSAKTCNSFLEPLFAYNFICGTEKTCSENTLDGTIVSQNIKEPQLQSEPMVKTLGEQSLPLSVKNLDEAAPSPVNQDTPGTNKITNSIHDTPPKLDGAASLQEPDTQPYGQPEKSKGPGEYRLQDNALQDEGKISLKPHNEASGQTQNFQGQNFKGQEFLRHEFQGSAGQPVQDESSSTSQDASVKFTGARQESNVLNHSLFGSSSDNQVNAAAAVKDSLRQEPIFMQLAPVIQKAIMQSSSQQTTLKLKLKPEHLGELTIQLIYSKGSLNAHFITADHTAKEAVESSFPMLREILAQNNIKLDEATVFTGNNPGNMPDKQDQSANRDNPFLNRGNITNQSTMVSIEQPSVNPESPGLNRLI